MNIVLLCVAVVVVWWCWRKTRSRAAEDAMLQAWQPGSGWPAGVRLRMLGERGMGGPVFGDVLCEDGVYLSFVWEQDFQTSADGRWLLKGDAESGGPYLIDRARRCGWYLSSATLAVLHARLSDLPAWEAGVATSAGAEAQLAEQGNYPQWLHQTLGDTAQPLVALQDLWLMPHELPDAPAAPAPQVPESLPAAVRVRLQRLPVGSLRREQDPLGAWRRANWQLWLDDQATPWVLDEAVHSFIWRDDGRAFACYGYAIQQGVCCSELLLLAWSVEQGWQHWSQTQPVDRKPWSIGMDLSDNSGDAAASGSTLQWDGDVLLQPMYVDTPELERLHEGCSIRCVVSEIEGCVGHSQEGQPLLAPVPQVKFWWRRALAQPDCWVAQSSSLAGQSLIWTLVQQAQDVHGAAPAYTLHWGSQPLPGLWELEHVLVQSRWAVLRPWGMPGESAGFGRVSVWDGQQLQALHLPWPVLRLRPCPPSSASPAPGVQVMAYWGEAQNRPEHASSGWWRWAVQTTDYAATGREDWAAVYAWRDVAPDAQGRWRLLPNWRRVSKVQSPCADGDYIWPLADGSDALWWWGGLNQDISNYWNVDEARIEGVCMTRSGAALYGVGPHAWPHPQGDGWAVLAYGERQYAEPDVWYLHWLRPGRHEVRTLCLHADRPQIHSWDAVNGLRWHDEPVDDEAQAASAGETPCLHSVRAEDWGQLPPERLQQHPCGLWLRPQDMAYADAQQQPEGWPWPQDTLHE